MVYNMRHDFFRSSWLKSVASRSQSLFSARSVPAGFGDGLVVVEEKLGFVLSE